MSDDDEAELRAMRAARAARGGPGGGRGGPGAGGLMDRHRRAAEARAASSAFYDDGGGGRGGGRPAPAVMVDDDDDDGGLKDYDHDDTPVVVPEEELYDGLRASFPLAFGEQEKSGPKLSEIHASTKKADAEVGPPRPPPAGEQDEEEDEAGPPRPPPGSGGDASEDEEGGEDEDFDPYQIPLSNEVALKGHGKIVSALAVDPAGARVVTGSYDYQIRMYDFGGMRADLRSFRSLNPAEKAGGDFVLRSLSWSPTGDQFLCVTGSAQPKIYDRDGLELAEMVRGDMYIRDMKNTKGHVTNCTGGAWHPYDRNTVITSGEDGVVRMWDVNQMEAQRTVIKPQPIKPGRVQVSTCCYSPDGALIAAGVTDGTIQVWGSKGKIGTSARVGVVAPPRQQLIAKQNWTFANRPRDILKKAHGDGSLVTCIAFSADGNTMASRATDETLKIWDVRKLSKPLKVFEGLPCDAEETGVCFSPTDELIVAGISAQRGGEDGGLVFFDKSKLEMVRRVRMPGTVTQVQWHPKLNQIFCGVGSKGYGGCHILYDPDLSEKGALACVARAPRKKDPFDYEAAPVVHNPHALKDFKESHSRKRGRDKERADPRKSKCPERPHSGQGLHGRAGSTGGSLLTQYLLNEQGMLKDHRFDNDPREALLKHADEAAANPHFFGKAYGDTQPKNILATVDEEVERLEREAAKRKASAPLPRPHNPLK